MSRFRPTSFRVAFGNTTEPEPESTTMPPPPPPPPTSTIIETQQQQIEEAPRPAEIRRIQIAQEDSFERIVVRTTPCQQCQCYNCNHHRRMCDQKINILLFLMFMMFVMIIVMAFKKSD